MKKHPLLQVEVRSTVKFSPREQKQMALWLSWVSPVLEKLLEEGLLRAPTCRTFQVSLLVAGDQRIRTLNKSFRGKDKTTDVLSFPSQDNVRQLRKLPEEFFLGDLAISAPVTRRQAREYDISFFDEFIHLFFHGLLHLIGYDHELSPKEEVLMQKWEDRALELFSEVKKRKGA